MKFSATDDQHILFDEIPPILAEWIVKIPRLVDAEIHSDAVESRLFPAPAGAENEEIREDWKAHVQPELHEWFLSARSLVSEDVKNLQQQDAQLTAWQRWTLRLHLSVCEACSRFERQIRFLRSALRRYSE